MAEIQKPYAGEWGGVVVGVLGFAWVVGLVQVCSRDSSVRVQEWRCLDLDHRKLCDLGMRILWQESANPGARLVVILARKLEVMRPL